MYVSGDKGELSKQLLDIPANGTLNGSANGHVSEKIPNGHVKHSDHAKDPVSSYNAMLKDLALEFAAQIPDDTFTPAELQNHLMKYKKEPQKAVRTAGERIDKNLADKSKHGDENDKGDEEDNE